ncbi:unnamed protein product, partial [Meganyctiphanes norvegica]
MTAFTKPWLWLFLVTQVAFAMKLYDYYIPDGVVTSGLMAEGQVFKLNGKDLRILSGAFHYFRVHPHYWRDTFRKIRAAGLNTVETQAWRYLTVIQGTQEYGNLSVVCKFIILIGVVVQYQEDSLIVLFKRGTSVRSKNYGLMPILLLYGYSLVVRLLPTTPKKGCRKVYSIIMAQIAQLYEKSNQRSMKICGSYIILQQLGETFSGRNDKKYHLFLSYGVHQFHEKINEKPLVFRIDDFMGDDNNTGHQNLLPSTHLKNLITYNIPTIPNGHSRNAFKMVVCGMFSNCSSHLKDAYRPE